METIDNLQWLRARHTSALRAVALLAVLLLVSIGVNVAQFLTKPEPAYFAVDGSGNVIPLVPVDQPLLTNDALAQFASETARRAYALNFVEAEAQLLGLRDRFSERAFAEFREAMAQSNLRQIQRERLVIEATAEPGMITRGGINAQGRYAWEVEVPVTLTSHFGSGQTRSQRLRVRMTIVRVDNRMRPESGVVITQFVSQLA